MPKRTDIKKIMVIGSGPIVIGQAAEFDYAGTQACLALKEEGYEVILVNSNPATIMTDNDIANKVYIEPLDIESLTDIIKEERPDGLLCSLGGQTGLNLGMELSKKGVLEKYNVELLGTSIDSIDTAEDRDLFKKMCMFIDEPVLQSKAVYSAEEALRFADEIGYPVIIRPAFTLGGTGGGFAENSSRLVSLATEALFASPIHQILIEKSVRGYKEIEYEVLRDKNDTAIVVCSMENVDPIGIHTGDSIVVAPTQTLADKEYQMLRNSALKIIRALGIEGGCNIQFALDPQSFRYYVIEVNPRVSRSSALASKASGYPIARVSAKIACGLLLNEIKIANTTAAFEPTLDYVVTKIPRFPFDKFPDANRQLGPQMKATGEVMAIGTTFEESLLKAIRSLEINVDHLELSKLKELTNKHLMNLISDHTDERIFAIAEAIRRRLDIKTLNELTKIDMFFLNKIKNIIDMERMIKSNRKNIDFLRYIKEIGFSDKYIARCWDMDEVDLYKLRKENHIYPVYKMIDTCAAEFNSYIPYFYSTYSWENESIVKSNKKVIILGSGPIRIGQGIEFDYATVRAIWALQKRGYEAIVINCNPETVSTDYTISDKLYFEPLTFEDVMNVIDLEKPYGVIVSLGGQTAINLADKLESVGVNILGSKAESIALTEDRKQFEELCEKLNIPMPEGITVNNLREGLLAAEYLGYPVLVRPSYVLGGRGMQVVYNKKQLRNYLSKAIIISAHKPVLIDKYIYGTELEVDAISDGNSVFCPGVMSLIERTGVHSGDSISVYSNMLPDTVLSRIRSYTAKLGLKSGIVGLFNIQFIRTSDDKIYVIEVNPRASRTIPFVSKASNYNFVDLAIDAMLGTSLKLIDGVKPKDIFNVKVPVFSFNKLPDVNYELSPEMKSTGEVMASASDWRQALIKAFTAAGINVNSGGKLLINADKNKLSSADYNTLSWCEYVLNRYSNFEIVTRSKNLDDVTLVVNLISERKKASKELNKKATLKNIPLFTCLDTFEAFVSSFINCID